MQKEIIRVRKKQKPLKGKKKYVQEEKKEERKQEERESDQSEGRPRMSWSQLVF